jgi:Family of unknown function (DUF6491)
MKRASIMAFLLLLAGCTGTVALTTQERLELYRAHAGEPVRSFRYNGHLWGWTALGDGALGLWTRSDQGYLIEFARRCPDLEFDVALMISSRGGQVFAGTDSIVVRRTSGGIGGVRCRIESIRPLDAQAVRESKRTLRAAELVERDPAEPDPP